MLPALRGRRPAAHSWLRSRHAASLVLGWGLVVGSATAQVAQPAQSAPSEREQVSASEALRFDLQRIVSAAAGGSWLIDELEQTAIQRDVMESVCRATPAVRAHALAHLEAAHARQGDARQLYDRAGELTDEVEAALATSRELEALRRAVAAAGSCPFWVHPEPTFRGRQSTRDRWVINFDTGGTAQLRRTQGDWAVGAGGFGRVLGGYSFTRLTLLAGLEFGGGALVEPNEQPTSLVVNYIPALPLLVRLHRDSWNVDFEAASVGLFQASNTSLSYGVRGGVTIGVSALRVRGVLPWVGLAVASEYHFANSARPEAWYLRSGLRVGGVWDP